MKKMFLSAILAICVSCLFVGGCSFVSNDGVQSDDKGNEYVKAERIAAGQIDYLFTEYEGFLYEAPSVIKDGEEYIISYTTNKTAGNEDRVIAVRKGTFTDGVFSFGEETVAVEPSEDGWDKYNLDNSDIVKGNFTYGGENYSYLMVYQANGIPAEKRMQIGAALSKDAITWVKVGNSPLLSYDHEALGDTAGLCYPSVVNLNGNANLLLFYSRATALGTETRFVEINVADFASLETSGEIAIPSEGLPLDGNEWGITVNADFAFDFENSMIYLVKDGFPYATNNAKKATKIEFAKIALSDLYAQHAAWTKVVSVLDGLDLGGYTRIYSAEFVTDGYSRINGNTLGFLFTSGVAAADIKDETYKFKNGMHYYEIPSSIRED